MPDLYRVTFSVTCPVSESDYAAIVLWNAGNFRGNTGFERFAKDTASYNELEFTSIPVDLDTATMLKLRFSGSIEKIG